MPLGCVLVRMGKARHLTGRGSVGTWQSLAWSSGPQLCIASILRSYITFKRTDTAVGGYSDAEYAGDSDNTMSTSVFLFMLDGGAFSWNSRLQPTVAV